MQLLRTLDWLITIKERHIVLSGEIHRDGGGLGSNPSVPIRTLEREVHFMVVSSTTGRGLVLRRVYWGSFVNNTLI